MMFIKKFIQHTVCLSDILAITNSVVYYIAELDFTFFLQNIIFVIFLNVYSLQWSH